jgi:hypothetical protein
MRAGTSIRVRLMLLKASVALAFAVAPFHIVVHPDGAGFELASAAAKDGSSGGGSSGSGGGSSGSGGGSSGSGRSGGGDGGSSGSGSGGGDSSGSGSSGDGRGGGDDHSGRDNSGPGRGNDDDRDRDRDRDNNRNDARDEHFNPATGARVEIQGNDIEVVFQDGTKEEIEAGRFERKNALGRTIVERPATQADFARLRAAAR